MRNLFLNQRRCIEKEEFSESRFLSIDFDTSKVYTGSNTSFGCLDPTTKEVEWTVDFKTHGFDYGSDGHDVVSIQHLPGLQSLCITVTNGDVLLYNTVTSELECVGSVENGICCMSWSPDQELVVLATAANTLLLMTKDFEPILETALQPDEFGQQKPITVGWGKKETQFHGSVGKQAATQQAENVKPALAWDDQRVRISWRGDGECFVVSSVNPSTGARQLRVWNRECILQSTSENVNGLEQGLAWKPSGSLIASSQVLPHRHDIVFFEKNGLRHGEFTLPFNKNQVKVNEILWNTESTILVLWLEDLPNENSSDQSQFIPDSYVQVWTVGNYHWYLKQSLHFSASQRVTALTFDPEHANQLHLLNSAGQYLRYSWTWQTTNSRGLDEDDQAVTAVIDGKDILVTPFKKMIVPPPISAYTLMMPTFVNQVVFAPPPHSNNMAVVLQDGRIAFYTHKTDGEEDKDDASVKLVAAGGNGFKSMVSPPKLRGMARIIDESGNPVSLDLPFHLHHFMWISADCLVAVSYNDEDCVSSLHHIKCLGLGTAELKLVCNQEESQPIFGEVVSVSCRGDDGSLAIQLDDGTVVDDNNEFITKLPQRCSHVAVCKLAGQEAILGLTERYRFYVNEMEIASNVTSFAITNEFLVLTTHSHTCRCISLDTKLEDLANLSEGKAVSLDESLRRVERGSRIVTAIASDTRLVLQMPRGNLETIHPRALVLASIKRCLDALKYKEAFTVMRRHRIDMNLIVDHNPQLLLNNIDALVTQLDDSTSLNLILMDLKEESVTKTMYAAAYHTPAPPFVLGAGQTSKVDVICDAIMESLQRLNPNRYFLSVLACHAKKTKPELEKALERIKVRQGSGSSEETDCPTADEALRYLLYLVDVNELYNVALGTYDFDLVLMVADKSQKDPKEYLPFLNQLRNMDPDYQRYSIDKHLKRYVKALGHVSRCPDHFSECLDLVREQRLYPEALKLFKRGDHQYKAVAQIYGEYLQEKNRYLEAALMYEMCDNLQGALEMYQKCSNWQEVFSLTARLKYSTGDEMELARKIAGQLASNRRHSEAAVVLIEYANDLEEAITTLVDGAHWEEALRLMYKHKRTDFIETTLKPALVENYESKIDSLANYHSTFERHKSRLAVVRETKARQLQEMMDGEGDLNDLDADLYSDASSMMGSVARSETGSIGSTGSTLSAYTAYSEGRAKKGGRAGKNRRKGERKKNSLKEGSRNEDIALMEAMSLIMKNVDSLRADVGVLLRMLIKFNHEIEAEALQNDLQSLLKLLQTSVDEIWPTQSTDDQTSQVYGPRATTNSIVASLTQLGGPQRSFTRDEMTCLVPPKLSEDQKWKLHLLESR
ncbi:putative elongator complex protein 1 [Lytechinus variegatus]|uniref:putative elongator complex protein 1 n=1 Tax=Lytechinus variegatus TaxID=7654 RepID=UPI001BB2AEA3|nr:putative elongator complex protein 1 [Lytechinus variegatus]